MKMCKKHERTLDASYSKHLYWLFYEENCDSIAAGIGIQFYPTSIPLGAGSSRET